MIRCGWGSARPRRLMLAAAAVLIPVLAGCEAGNSAPTLQFHYPTDAAGTAVGGLSVRNVFILGAPLGQSLRKGQSASLFLALVNDGAPDKLISITANGNATSVSLPAGGVPVIYQHPVFLTGPRPELVLENLTRSITNGSSIRLILTFQKAGAITLLVPVEPRALHYQTYAPPQPSASASTSAATPAVKVTRHRTRKSPSPSPSVSLDVTASPSPSAS